jgi:cobyrinic acid a,c-diamide synthase
LAHRCLVVAGTHSGVGKTTVALALMAALRRRGLRVQPFKVGPDFIDSGHHTAICGRASRNLDTWILSDETVWEIFVRASADAEISVIEGVMGLFDGRSADDARGSTAHLAKLLGAPVLLVVDAEAVAGSIAATVKGFAELDPAVQVIAVLCNRVAGPGHYAHLEPAIRRHTQVLPIGWLPRRPEWQIPERHLGLVTRQDLGGRMGGPDLEQLAAAFVATVDVDALLHELRRAPDSVLGTRYSVLGTRYSVLGTA